MNEHPDREVIRAFTVTPSSISRIRVAHGMTVPAFARYIGITAATLTAWENGTSRPRGRLEERALDSVVDEAQLRFPGLQIGLEPNPDAEAARRGANP